MGKTWMNSPDITGTTALQQTHHLNNPQSQNPNVLKPCALLVLWAQLSSSRMREWAAFVRQIFLAWICNVVQTSMISSFTVQTNHPGSCYKADFGASGWGPRVYISDKLPGNAGQAGPQTSLWAPKIKWESEKDSGLLQNQTILRHRIWSPLAPCSLLSEWSSAP